MNATPIRPSSPTIVGFAVTNPHAPGERREPTALHHRGSLPRQKWARPDTRAVVDVGAAGDYITPGRQLVTDLAKLRIWDDPATRGALSWYSSGSIMRGRRETQNRRAPHAKSSQQRSASSWNARTKSGTGEITPIWNGGMISPVRVKVDPYRDGY